jgi:hypothetical protein
MQRGWLRSMEPGSFEVNEPYLRDNVPLEDGELPGQSYSFAAIRTSSASESARIFRITCPRCIFTVISLVPSS